MAVDALKVSLDGQEYAAADVVAAVKAFSNVQPADNAALSRAVFDPATRAYVAANCTGTPLVDDEG